METQRKLLSGRQKDPIELQEVNHKNSYYFRIYILFCISIDFNKYRESFCSLLETIYIQLKY